uniref:Uncharacterized protein n=1 Tax=Meloidogyne enterolobii TaxID=390850 RepID=A0A6V7W9V3_MELEN|nr:unnamed protein product [Meloidogyne enterolobii]
MYQNEKFNCKQNNLIINFQKLIFKNMKTPKQLLEEWSFSSNNSDNINNDSEDKTLVEEEENFTEKSYSNIRDEILESNSCSSCCLSQNMIENLKQRLEKLELKLKINEQSLEISNLKHEKAIFLFLVYDICIPGKY